MSGKGLKQDKAMAGGGCSCNGEGQGCVSSLESEVEELKKRSEGYRRVVEISLDAMVAVDEDGVITLWNPAAGRLFGYSSEEILGSNVERLVPPDLREKHRLGMDRFMKTGFGPIIGKVVEVEGLGKDGSLVPVEMSLSAGTVDGRWVFMAILRDDAARRKLEEELKNRLVEVERLAKTMVGREIKMEELRRELAEYKKKAECGD